MVKRISHYNKLPPNTAFLCFHSFSPVSFSDQQVTAYSKKKKKRSCPSSWWLAEHFAANEPRIFHRGCFRAKTNWIIYIKCITIQQCQTLVGGNHLSSKLFILFWSSWKIISQACNQVQNGRRVVWLTVQFCRIRIKSNVWKKCRSLKNTGPVFFSSLSNNEGNFMCDLYAGVRRVSNRKAAVHHKQMPKATLWIWLGYKRCTWKLRLTNDCGYVKWISPKSETGDESASPCYCS